MPIKKSTLQDAKRFEYTATGILGLSREPMLQNEVHQREPLGRNRTRGRPKQDLNFIYGHKYPLDNNGVAKCMVWDTSHTKEINPDDYPRDYIKTNIKALTFGSRLKAIDANYRLVPFAPRKKDVIRSYPGGKPSAVGEPMGEIISQQYHQDWFDDAIRRRLKQMDDRNRARAALRRPFDNLCSVYSCKKRIPKGKFVNFEDGEVKMPPSDEFCQCDTSDAQWLFTNSSLSREKGLWTMPRFSKIAPQISSYRTQKERVRAYLQMTCA